MRRCQAHSSSSQARLMNGLWGGVSGLPPKMLPILTFVLVYWRQIRRVIARNHLVESAIRAAEDEGDFKPFNDLLAVIVNPYDDLPENSPYTIPPEPHEVVHQDLLRHVSGRRLEDPFFVPCRGGRFGDDHVRHLGRWSKRVPALRSHRKTSAACLRRHTVQQMRLVRWWSSCTGFPGSRKMMQGFSLSLARAGYTAVAIDLPGHGDNLEPMSSNITEIEGATVQFMGTLRQVIDSLQKDADPNRAGSL